MSFEWWQLLIFTSIGMFAMLAGVFLGAWMVFRTRTISLGAPFIPHSFGDVKNKKPESYMPQGSSFFDEEAITKQMIDENLTSAASRLRDQKTEYGSAKL